MVSFRSCAGWSKIKHDEPGDDLVSGLIAARDEDERLDDRELLSTIFQLIVAGHDTTATFIGNAVVALLGRPRSARDAARVSESDSGGGGGAVAIRRPRAPLDLPLRRANRSSSADIRSLPAPRSSFASLPPTVIPVASPTPNGSTWKGQMGATWHSGTESTTAWAPRSLASRVSSRWDRSSDVFPGSASPATGPDCTGATETGSCCVACPSCQSFSVPACRGSTNSGRRIACYRPRP